MKGLETMLDNGQKKIKDLQLEVMSNCVNIKKKNFKKGEYILSFGLRQKVIGFILSGKADIIRITIDGEASIIQKLTPGSIFNDAFSCFSKDSVFVISKTDTEIFFIDYPIIFKNCPVKCPYHNHLIDQLLNLITENNIKANEKIEILTHNKIRDRILAYISINIGNSNTTLITIPYSFTELAEYLCVDRSSLMRELKKMEEEKLIKRENKTLILLNV